MTSPKRPSRLGIRVADRKKTEGEAAKGPAESYRRGYPFWDFAAVRSNLSAIRARSGSDAAFIFRMTWPRCTFTVISLMPTQLLRTDHLVRITEVISRHFPQQKCLGRGP